MKLRELSQLVKIKKKVGNVVLNRAFKLCNTLLEINTDQFNKPKQDKKERI